MKTIPEGRRSRPVRVIHTVRSTRDDHGGTSRSVPALCDALATAGAEVHLMTTRPGIGDGAPRPILPKRADADAILRPDGWRGVLTDSMVFRKRLEDAVGLSGADILHDHGLWLGSNWAAHRVALRTRTPFVLSPRGMVMSPGLRYRRTKKRIALFLYQRRILEAVNLFHVTSNAEAEAVRTLGLTQPCAVIPNAVELPREWEPIRGPRRRLLFLSRVHPTKGLPMLFRAWARAAPKGWELVIAGPDQLGHRKELEHLAEELDIRDTVQLWGAVPDAEKWTLYRSADLFVLPTYSENFGTVVAESLASGVPVITTTAAPWQELNEQKCGWWVSPTEESLEDVLREAVSLSDGERREMGSRGRFLVANHYTWEATAEAMLAAYEWLLGGGGDPGMIV